MHSDQSNMKIKLRYFTSQSHIQWSHTSSLRPLDASLCTSHRKTTDHRNTIKCYVNSFKSCSQTTSMRWGGNKKPDHGCIVVDIVVGHTTILSHTRKLIWWPWRCSPPTLYCNMLIFHLGKKRSRKCNGWETENRHGYCNVSAKLNYIQNIYQI